MNLIMERKEQQFKLNVVSKIFWSIIIAVILLIVVPYTPFGSEQIGSLFEKNEYITYYYVNMFPENSESKNYKVIAQILANDKNYIIQKAYSSSDAYITFDNFIFGLPNDSLKFNEKVYIEDDNGRKWNIELINEQPTEQKVNELKK